jgi:Zinc-ribbon
MTATWSAIAMGIALQPVPPDMARVVHIVCNDCEERDKNRRWHFLGVRCMHCMSFNTVVEETPMQGREAADYLDALEASMSTPVPETISTNSGAGGDLMEEDVPSAQETYSGSSYMES